MLFERADHPLIERLRGDGVQAGSFDDEPDAPAEGLGLVTEPDAALVLELARRGARVLAGPAHPPDDLTAAHAAPVVRRAAASMSTLAAIMARLRSEDGCPWDREQTHGSLKVHLLEEAHEVIDAIDAGLTGLELREELGDVLLQVAFHARLAAQEGRFDLADVGDEIVAKLVHRHPHVFGSAEVASAGEVVHNWEALKAAERDGEDDPFDSIPRTLPALLTAYKTQKRAARFGFAPDEAEARHRLAAALERADPDLGEALFWLVALARARGEDPEGALRTATRRFRKTLEERSSL